MLETRERERSSRITKYKYYITVRLVKLQKITVLENVIVFKGRVSPVWWSSFTSTQALYYLLYISTWIVIVFGKFNSYWKLFYIITVGWKYKIFFIHGRWQAERKLDGSRDYCKFLCRDSSRILDSELWKYLANGVTYKI